MTSLSIPPPARIAIGTAQVGAQRIEIFLNSEWARYFESLNSQVVIVAGAAGLPGTAGATGATGATGSAVSLLSESDDGSVEFVPGPPGQQGPQGDPGPVVFLMQEPEDNDVFWPIRNT